MSKKSEKIIYFDCYGGISGDMALGALLDCGVRLSDLQEMLRKLDLTGYSLEAENIMRGGISGTRAIVRTEEDAKVHRHLKDIEAIIKASGLPGPVKNNSTAVFKSLAEAEAAVHNITIEKVHFHEVGALDAIIDITGTCAALYLLGIERIFCSPLPASRGTIEAAHGRLPLPAPATLELIARRQAPVEGKEWGYELVTPTGAALVTTLAESFGPLPAFNISSVGYGAGSIDPGYANYLRLLYGFIPKEKSFSEEELVAIEANIDDLNPEIYGYLMEKIICAGAFDVYFTPIQMKKNRPGVQLTVLSPPEKVHALQELIFSETTTLGLRTTPAAKAVRQREIATVSTQWGEIRIKYTPDPTREFPLQYAPEYEDCRAVAEKSGTPLKDVYRLAERLFQERHFSD